MRNISKYTKWCVCIDNLDVNMPTKEHAVRIGKYLQSFGVPVKIAEVVFTVETLSPGKFDILGKERIMHNILLKQSPTNKS